MANFTTPLATDEYSRTMGELFDERQVIGVPTMFQSFFGDPASGSKTLFQPNSKIVEIDIIRANGERLAELINRGGGGRNISGQKNTNEQKYTTFSRSYPLIEEEGDMTADQILDRVAGENPYSQMDRLDRQRLLALGHHQEHIRRSVRTFEYLASESILNGQMPAIIGTTETDLIYDFKRLATHSYTVSVKWDNASAVIMDDIDTACDLIRKDAYISPDMAILGADTMNAFINDSEVRSVADNRRFELILISENNPIPPKFNKLVKSGAIARGRLRTPAGYELWLFTYIDGYTNSSGTFTNYMPKKKVLIGYSGSRCDRYFGPPEILPLTANKRQWYMEMFGFSLDHPPMPPNIKTSGSVIDPRMFYYDAYQSNNNKTVTLRTQSAPIFAATQTDAFVTMTVLT